MTPSPDLNLDRLVAQYAQSIVNGYVKETGKKGAKQAQAVDGLVTKALGVVQENGVYAGVLFLLSRKRKEDQDIASIVVDELLKLARELPFGWAVPSGRDAATLLPFYSDTVCADLAPLLLVKELYEQTLIYARYGAKAAANQAEKKKEPPQEATP
ncbi:MAG: hypothetical protein KKA73_00830 [Chloroflexi bacterium]|nr:hypothetical protein [Chloroflexota bacterium]MBU1746207.1 hypothetical protein [Chloroflexota bacterium]